MKHIFIKTVALGLLAVGMASCSKDLDISPIDPQSSYTYDEMSLLAKQYATLGLTGQKGPAGSPDLSMDEGESSFYRTTFNLEELCSDELIWAWQNDTDIPAITFISWNKDSQRVLWTYSRLAYDITLFNQFLQENGTRTEGEWGHYNAEVRFLRALHFYYFLDLFHKAPFKIVYDPSVMPVEKAGKDLYDWLDNELTEIEPLLASIGSFNTADEFGRADQGAAYALHARLALNSEVYTDGATQDYQKAIDYANKVIDSGKYSLSSTAKNGYSGYEQVFMADNDENTQAMNEIIFPIRQDGIKTQQHGGSTYLVASALKSGMPYTGTTTYWSCNFARYSLLKFFFDDPEKDCPYIDADEIKSYLGDTYGRDEKGNNKKGISDLTEEQVIAADDALRGSTESIVAAANDDRALFYGGCGGGTRTLSTKQITSFNDGLSIVKWKNLRSDNGASHSPTFMDTDIPLFRLAELYLTRAEASFRLGNSSQALSDINVLRRRANAANVTSVDKNTILNEWGREFYMEGRRRSDLVRFGMFTSTKYVWPFKGGVAAGSGVDKKFNVYPIPATDDNPNIQQNSGY